MSMNPGLLDSVSNRPFHPPARGAIEERNRTSRWCFLRQESKTISRFRGGIGARAVTAGRLLVCLLVGSLHVPPNAHGDPERESSGTSTGAEPRLRSAARPPESSARTERVAVLAADTEPLTTNFAFKVFWPPQDPAEPADRPARPLLNGDLVLQSQGLSDGTQVMRLRIILSRPTDEAGREFWNSRLAFPEVEWMRSVRVWDQEHRWLWPNLAYLLRLHGIERVERYGGVDPGKGVDNDFAAVLIRKYDADGTSESATTRHQPLVSAEWQPQGAINVDRHTFAAAARSDEFSLHLGRPRTPSQGTVAVWLIYADFMGARLPKGWPQTLEYAGGILSYFEVQWNREAGPNESVRVRHLAPRRATGFDWERWVTRTRSAQTPQATARLSD